VDTNLLGTLCGCRVAIAGMRGQPGGSKVYTFEGFGSAACPGRAVGLRGHQAGAATSRRRSPKCAHPVIVGSLSPGIVATDLLLYSSRGQDPAEWERSKRVLNILGDTVETVTPSCPGGPGEWLKQGGRIDWMTPAKAAGRFALAPFRKRDILAELEARPHLTVR
jgi:hypothetical protein